MLHNSTPSRPLDNTQSSPQAHTGSDQLPRPTTSGQSGRNAQARMRSSIACVRCRRSKVKCVNTGVGIPCRSCEASGRDCTYPVPVTGGRRREGSLSGSATRPEGLADVETRKPRQHRKSIIGQPGPVMSTVPEAPPAAPISILDANVITPSVWQELFDIFQTQYSIDLPFIHSPTFLKPLRQATTHALLYKSSTSDASPNIQPPASIEFLLAFLALTARFHPKLIAHHCPPVDGRASDPLKAAQFYASEAASRLSSPPDNASGLYNLQAVQALLMLTLHEWGIGHQSKAWTFLRTAVTSAQAMGLHYERDLDESPHARCFPIEVNVTNGEGGSDRQVSNSPSADDAFVQQEVRRRTFWTCFILDRYLSNGKFKLQSLSIKDIRIQLPASEQAFLFGGKVHTLLLGEEQNNTTSRPATHGHERAPSNADSANGSMNRYRANSNATNGKSLDDDKARWEVGAEEGLLSRYIKILDIYGKVTRWACGGGRRRDTLPPWSASSEWYDLRKSLDDFRNTLPRQHVLTTQNTSAHINLRTSTSYVLVHTTYLLCQVLLHREFLPFVPLRSGKPQGPSSAIYNVYPEQGRAPGFWEASAIECFGASRDIVDLILTCDQWGVSVSTPVVGFALYNVALLGTYLINFPWMDVHGYLRRATPTGREECIAGGAEASRKAIELLLPLRRHLRLAEGWLQTIKRSNRYFSHVRQIWVDFAARLPGTMFHDQSIATAQLHPPDGESTRVLLERTLKDVEDGPPELNTDMRDVRNGESKSSNGTMPPPESDYGSPHISNGHGPQHPRHVQGHNRSYSQLSQSQISGASEQQQQAHLQQERWNAINTAAAAVSAGQTISGPGSSAQFRSYPSYPLSTSDTSPSNYGHAGYRAPQHNGAPSNGHVNVQAPTWPSTNGGREAMQNMHAHVKDDRSTPSQTRGRSESAASHYQRGPSDRDTKDIELWLNSVERDFMADDVAAFIDGVEAGEYAIKTVKVGSPGWLACVWGLA